LKPRYREEVEGEKRKEEGRRREIRADPSA
jgi:hypothetical protein